MKRLLLLFCLLLPALFAQGAAATVWTADNIPMVHLQDARRYVCNPDGVLSAAATDSIDAMLYQLEHTRGVQSVVVAVRRVKDADCYQFAMALGRKYGVGSKRQNTGLIVVLSTEDRRYQIIVGEGLEGTLPDAICKRIENRLMVPQLKAADWDGAMKQGVGALCRYIEGDAQLKAGLDSDTDDGDDAVSLVMMLVFIFIFVASILFSRRRRCPNCHRRSYVKVSRTFLYTQGGWDYYRVVYACRRCGYTHVDTERDSHSDNDGGALLTGAVLGSLLGGRGGGGSFGGGFGGGSFGGGSFGGGGAGGGF
jgi:uncharacterized protein